jgi:hypothetical protein
MIVTLGTTGGAEKCQSQIPQKMQPLNPKRLFARGFGLSWDICNLLEDWILKLGVSLELGFWSLNFGSGCPNACKRHHRTV